MSLCNIVVIAVGKEQLKLNYVVIGAIMWLDCMVKMN